eukprot:snap_masked-scaffold_4-processed-gene-17.32-mRNA-1 protein AED:0.05 eAED:0.05 QI:0/-1/0/1/-1/1/1/0/477
MVLQGNSANLYLQGKNYLAKAIEADENKNYPLASVNYTRACELFLLGVKRDRNRLRRHQNIERVQRYISRLEVVKELLAEKEHKPQEKKKFVKKGGLDDVAGLDFVKQNLKEATLLPLLQPQLFKGKRKPWKGVLLFGPPGTGKSFVVSKLSEELDMTFIPLSSAEIVSKWQGESEKALKRIFKEAKESVKKTGKPCVIFIDEIDSIGMKRDGGEKTESMRRVLNQLLLEMQDLIDAKGPEANKIMVVGATNHAHELDFALRRRFEKRIYLPLPGIQTRYRIFRQSLVEDTDEGKKAPMFTEAELGEFAKRTKGFSSADVAVISRDILMLPVRKCLHAKYFKYVFIEKRSKKGFLSRFGANHEKVLVPCEENDVGAMQMRMLDEGFPTKKLHLPKVTLDEVLGLIKKAKPSVSAEDVKKHEAIAKEFSSGKDIHLEDDEDFHSLGVPPVNTHFKLPSVSHLPMPKSREDEGRVPLPG